MTLASTSARIQYAGSPPTVAFAFPYLFLDEDHLTVILTSSAGVDTTLVIVTDYTVVGEGDPSGGTVTLVTAPAVGEKLTIFRDVPATQLVDYVANDAFPAETHEQALDKLTMLIQQLLDSDNRSLVLPVTEPSSTSTELPAIGERLSTVLGFDGSGNLVAYDLTSIPIDVGSSLFSISSPAGSTTSKSITVTIAGATVHQRVRAWLVDVTATEPTLEKALVVPDVSNVIDFDTVSSAAGVATITVEHTGASTQWKMVIEVSGVLKLSSSITLGV